MSKEDHSKEAKPKKVKKIYNKSKHKEYHDKSHIPYSLNLITPIINDLLLSESISSITQENNSLTIIHINPNTKYIGETIDSKPNGFGIYSNPTYEYKGMWCNSKKNGYGILKIKPTGEEYRAFFKDDVIEGFCEKIINNNTVIIRGILSKGKYIDIITIEDSVRKKRYEGEVEDEQTNISIGRIYELKENKNQYYSGEIYLYQASKGFGYLLKENSCVYIGQFRKKQLSGFSEAYCSDEVKYGVYNNGKKEGIFVHYKKDGKMTFGNYSNDIKHGPFFLFSNCSKMDKAICKMILYLYGFKTKVVDGYENSVSYIQLYYPEFIHHLHFPYLSTNNYLVKIMKEENDYFGPLIQKKPKEFKEDKSSFLLDINKAEIEVKSESNK